MDYQPLLRESPKERSSPWVTRLSTVNMIAATVLQAERDSVEWQRLEMGHYGSRGNTVDVFQPSADPQRKHIDITEYQEEQLRRLYLKLALLSPDDIFVNRQTFCHYFQLERCFIRKLFTHLDRDRTGRIAWDDFLEGISTCIYGSTREKCKLVFCMFRSRANDKESWIGMEEISVFALSAVKILLRYCLCYQKPDGYSEQESALAGDLARTLAEDALTNVCPPHPVNHQGSALDSAQFTNWLMKYPSLIQALFDHPSLVRLGAENKENATELNQFPPQIATPISQTWMNEQKREEEFAAEGDPDSLSMSRSRVAYEWTDLSGASSPTAGTPPMRSNHVAVEYHGFVYVYGGRGKHRTLKDLWRYSLERREWETINSSGRHRPSVLLEHSAVQHGGCMYIFGGAYSHDDREAPLWCLNLESHEWEDVTSVPLQEIPSNRRGHSAVLFNQCMYIFGGYINPLGASEEMWKHDFAERQWTKISSTSPKRDEPPPRYFHDAEVYGHAMWMYGGLNNLERLADFWRFDFELLSWLRIRSRRSPPSLFGHTLCSVDKELFLFGGQASAVEWTNEIWKYEFDTYAWSKVNQTGYALPHERAHHVIVPVSRRVVERHARHWKTIQQDRDATLKQACRGIAKQLLCSINTCRPRQSQSRMSLDHTAPLDAMPQPRMDLDRNEMQILLIGGQCSKSREVYKKYLETWLLNLGPSRHHLPPAAQDTTQEDTKGVVFVNPVTDGNAPHAATTAAPPGRAPMSEGSFSYEKLNNLTTINV